MKVAVISYPGSFDLANTRRVLVDLLGVEAEEFSHEIDSLDLLSKYDLAVLPGGASFSDAVYPGRLARASKITPTLKKYVEGDGRLLGIGNGFQILCEIGILPGSLLRNRNCGYLNDRLLFTPANRESVFTLGLPADGAFTLPVSCYFGRYFADRRTFQEIEEKGQVAFQYCTRFGDPDTENPRHGSLNGIAGVLNRKKNALGVIFHPERSVDPEFGPADGLTIFKSFLGASS